MRKFLLVILLFILMLFQSVSAVEVYKIKGVSFDTSGSVIFLNTSGSYQSSITDKIKIVKQPDNSRLFFDINSAVLLSKKQDLLFNQGNIKEIKISQFSTQPSVVRVVMYFDNTFNTDNLKIGNINNNLVITTAELSTLNTQFYQNTYRDKPQISEDYSEDLIVQSKTLIPQNNLVTINDQNHSVKQLSQIQQAFGSSNIGNSDVGYKDVVLTNVSDDVKLRSKYYLNSITQKNNGFLINGYGALSIQQPMVLSNPTRMVFDFANANVNSDLVNKEIFLNSNNANGDKLKIGQYSDNIVRAVVTSDSAKKYIPVFSPDNQSLILVNPENIASTAIALDKTNAVQYIYNKNLSTNDLTIRFDNPIVWGIKRNSDKLYVYFFNAVQYNEKTFENIFKKTPFSEARMSLLKNIGIRLTLPLIEKSEISTYLSSDGKNFRIRAANLGEKIEENRHEVVSPVSPSSPPIITNFRNGNKSVVLDAGHGGTDYGAIRNGINEKDINLDVAKRVEAILRHRGVNVYMARTTDVFVSLEDRCKYTARVNPNIFVSIHVNSCMGTEPRGVETHYYHDNSVPLANIIHNKLTHAVSSPNRGLFKSRFYVINHTSVPAVLVEIGFISNDRERAALTTPQYKQTIAEAIAEGIIEFYNSQK